MRFLVVDDSSTMRRIVVNSLQRIGFTDAVEAGDGEEALAKFDASVKFVITDWNMPNMTGTELARALRERGCPRSTAPTPWSTPRPTSAPTWRRSTGG